ncbi:MAG TPA: hypothetical protein VLE97_07105 [Gaiellaceae bacterium]|nr:hypothetical protein [Gaiellaceae bacterium]
MVEGNGAAPIDELKVRAMIALCDELRALSPDDPQYAVVLRQLDARWRALSPTEQDEIDRIFGQRGLVRPK